MSDTFRTDRDGNKRKEGLHKKQKTHICRCEYCTGVSRNLICEKIAAKELKTEIKQNHQEDIIWDKQGEVCNDYCCTVRDFICDFEEIVKKFVINY